MLVSGCGEYGNVELLTRIARIDLRSIPSAGKQLKGYGRCTGHVAVHIDRICKPVELGQVQSLRLGETRIYPGRRDVEAIPPLGVKPLDDCPHHCRIPSVRFGSVGRISTVQYLGEFSDPPYEVAELLGVVL